MIHRLKVLINKTEGLSLIARIHMVEGEIQQPQSCSLSDRDTYTERGEKREGGKREEGRGAETKCNLFKEETHRR